MAPPPGEARSDWHREGTSERDPVLPGDSRAESDSLLAIPLNGRCAGEKEEEEEEEREGQGNERTGKRGRDWEERRELEEQHVI